MSVRKSSVMACISSPDVELSGFVYSRIKMTKALERTLLAYIPFVPGLPVYLALQMKYTVPVDLKTPERAERGTAEKYFCTFCSVISETTDL